MNSPWPRRFLARVLRPAAWLGVLGMVVLGAVLGLLFNQFNPAGLRLSAARPGQLPAASTAPVTIPEQSP